MKKLFARMTLIVCSIAMVVMLTACSTSGGNDNVSFNLSNQSIELGNFTQSGKDWTITVGDELTNIGIRNGSSIRVSFDSNSVTLYCDLRVELSTWTKDQIVSNLTEMLKQFVGEDVANNVAVTSTEFFTTENRVKFTVTFNLS